ncbi:hypothetical protein GCM10027445_40550 [Amycolatopsis endophytica]|uniref:FtsX extracellular domain-containing protein n=1 Tax=Amycolatopsis endophytica TaxID=860233 RepID=A0A853B7T6_9PSEU|nr:permease-like cell division protein FtsX [Amycolatopsis endophytica]NYI90814.1 hypothetical protein [Amycolatopsis endophytica]
MRPETSGRRVVLPLALLAVVLAAIAVAAVLLWPGDEKPVLGPAPVIPRTGHQVCADNIMINTDTDAEMSRIANAVRADPRARKVYTETRDEAFARFKDLFKDQPDLLAHARAEALPFSVTVTAAGDVDLHAWAAELTATFPEATSVRPMIRSEVLAGLPPSYGTEAPAPCPAGGEWE